MLRERHSAYGMTDSLFPGEPKLLAHSSSQFQLMDSPEHEQFLKMSPGTPPLFHWCLRHK
jgi:hypothetical protein